MSQFPEHDKLAKVREESQAQGEFIDWLMNERGVALMVFRDDLTQIEKCPNDCLDGQVMVEYAAGQPQKEFDPETRSFKVVPAPTMKCDVCGGRGWIDRTAVPNWVPVRESIQELLAQYHGIDRRKLEEEKREMLDILRRKQQDET